MIGRFDLLAVGEDFGHDYFVFFPRGLAPLAGGLLGRDSLSCVLLPKFAHLRVWERRGQEFQVPPLQDPEVLQITRMGQPPEERVHG